MPDALPVDEAERLIREHVQPFPTCEVETSRAAGRVLREDLLTDRDLPPYDRVTMDGIALSFSALAAGQRTFPILDTQPAGQPRCTMERADGCIRVMTGAVLPKGTDCVIPREYVTFGDNEAEVDEEAPAGHMEFVHPQGVDARAGDLVVGTGRREITPPIALTAAAVGRSVLRVAALPSVAVVSNGDELVPVQTTPAPHQVRASNAHGLLAALRVMGVTEIESVHYPDDEDAITRGLGQLLARHNVLLLSGGISAGDFDFMPGALKRLKVRKVFHRVQQRPGKPFWFGLGPDGQPVFALPGNPVSTLVCFYRYIRPWLLAGQTGAWPEPERVALAAAVEQRTRLARFLPVCVAYDLEGRRMARPVEHHGSGDYASLAATDGFVEIRAAAGPSPVATAVPYYPWHAP